MSVMNNVRANWMIAFRDAFGVKQVVTRKELSNWQATWQPNQVGPKGFELHAPSWLTNNNTYKVSRGVFRLPWEDLEKWEAAQTAASNAPTAPSPQEVTGVAAGVVTTSDAEDGEVPKCCGATEPCPDCPSTC
jgi:hypothetical protein